MISLFKNLESFNDGTVKSVSVWAKEDDAGGKETILFDIINDKREVLEDFKPREGKVVKTTHSSSGQGLVVASAQNSTATIKRWLDVDKQPGDAGEGSKSATGG